MIKIVLDANVLISGMLGFPGPSREIINLALGKDVVVFGSSKTYMEFCEKMHLPRLQKYLKRQIYSTEKVIMDYKAFVTILEPAREDSNKRFVLNDPDDDEYVRVARACNSKIIVTGDNHFLEVKRFGEIRAVRPAKFLASYRKLNPRS